MPILTCCKTCTICAGYIKIKSMKKLTILLCTALFLTACEKDIEALPDATQTGANTFGAKVDGALWVPQKSPLSSSDMLLEAVVNGTGSLLINARNFSASPNETEFEILLKNFTGPGTYTLNSATPKYPYETASYGYFIKRNFMPLNEWMTTSTHSGSVTVSKYDEAAGIVSGTFEFDGKSIDSSAQTLKVTEGRFDIKL